jgi:hypothetical protein
LEEAIRFQPDNIDALNNLTWVLAMPGGSRSENAAKAWPLAHRMQELVGNNNLKAFRTIAAAYAANAKFAEALDICEAGRAIGARTRRCCPRRCNQI